MSDLGLVEPVRPALTPSAELLRLHLPSPVSGPLGASTIPPGSGSRGGGLV
jgi:hypothetical protein